MELFAQPDYFDIFKGYRGRAAFLQGMSALANEMIEGGRQFQANRNDVLIQEIQNYIDANLAGDLSLQTIADAFYVNPAYLCRVYKQRTGITIGEEITSKRIALAKRMLSRKEYKIYEIANKSGYESAAYFTRVFKKHEGVSPQAWRDVQR